MDILDVYHLTWLIACVAALAYLATLTTQTEDFDCARRGGHLRKDDMSVTGYVCTEVAP